MWTDILKSQVFPLTDITVENENKTSVKKFWLIYICNCSRQSALQFKTNMAH